MPGRLWVTADRFNSEPGLHLFSTAARYLTISTWLPWSACQLLHLHMSTDQGFAHTHLSGQPSLPH